MNKQFCAVALFLNIFFSLFLHAENKGAATDEVLFVRRIMEFWKDNENQIVESQIKQFLTQYPTSEFAENLQVLLGDSLRIRKKYQEGLAAYDAILSPELKEKVFASRLDCLYHLEHYQTLATEIAGRLPKEIHAESSSEQKLWAFYYAESLLQRGKKSEDPEEAKSYFEQASPYFIALQGSEHDLNARLALAEIAITREEPQRANDIYLALSESYPEKKAEVLFYAARIQSVPDPKQAIFLFSYVQGLGGPYASDAVMNKAQLMYQQEQFAQLIKEKEALKAAVVSEKQPLLNLIIGQSHFALKQYEEAVTSLRSVLKMGILEPQDEKKALLLSMASLHHLHELTDLQALKVHLNIAFPHDVACAHALYLEALTLKDCGRFPEAQANLKEIIQTYPSFEKMESVEFEHASLLFKQERWQESRSGLIAFVQKYPSSRYHLTALQHIPHATLKQLEVLNEEDASITPLRQQFVTDIQLLLNTPDAVTPIQKPKFQLAMCKTLYELKQYDLALKELKSYLQSYPHDEFLYQVHLLAAMCYQNENNNQNFIEHAEKVVQLKPTFIKTHQLRISLFNAYFQLAQHQEQIQGDPFPHFNQAAEHLFVVMKEDQKQLDQGQQLWLANHYYHQAGADANDYAVEPLHDARLCEAAEKAVMIYLSFMKMSAEGTVATVTADSLYLEQELYKLSNLYGWLKKPAKQVEILRNVIQQQNNNLSWEWNLRTRYLFSLAYALEQQKELDQAKELYVYLTATMPASDPYVLNASKLQLARLTFESLPASKKNLEDPDLIAILKQLKDLHIRKSLAQEPIHLEAGLEYAHMRTSLEPREKQNDQMLFLLKRLKQDFTAQEDIASKDYHASRQQMPQKDLIYQAYMMLIDASIARLEAEKAQSKGKLAEKQYKAEAAKSIYTNLIHGKFAVSKYLVHQAKSGLATLEASDEIVKRGF